jgi:hypothetical protein
MKSPYLKEQVDNFACKYSNVVYCYVQIFSLLTL